jgi:pimeloyl-ACP methyl ester carboxylesterase
MRALVLTLLLLATSAQAEVRLVGDLPRKAGKALVDLPGLETEYGQVRTSEGNRLRTILTRPAGTTGRLPAIFLAQWVSCGSADFGPASQSELKMIADQSGMVFVRVERSGDGDSEGVPCAKLDYDTELRQYREAFDQIARHPWIDPDRIIIFGSSLGSTTAPLIADGKKVAGIAVQGGGAETYLERMINFDRLFLERSGQYRPEQIQAEMLRRIPFHYEYLVRARTPQQVESEHPELKGVAATIRGLEADNHYGRPFAWHQQAAKHDFLAAWAKVEAPVLVVYGEYDQFEMRDGHKLIADTVNRLRPGTATFIEVPRANHGMSVFANAEDAYNERNGARRADLLAKPLVEWARKVTGLTSGR